MNMFSQVLIGLLMVLVDNAAVIKDESQCTAKVVGSLCKSHADCYCPNTYILCNHEKRCENASLALISILLPCPKIFKTRCESDADCTCSEERLKCEQNECVRFKKNGGNPSLTPQWPCK
ncbi:uncharacterized protein LOC110250895 [Exaiptasia diaphana]|uniref:Uncharacterized protein n=1 Tax=Exaiptasia diaphana TaxID=2652724 RepID=A0A913YVI9_EXADI|nr:uncharacterized protein LOC110250895 [Exaiptasia diaphana]